MKKWMKARVVGGILFPLLGGGVSVAQDAGEAVKDSAPRAVLNSHRVSAPVAACLAALDEDCIVSAALNTVMEESLSVERIKVLTAMAQASAEAGQRARAQQLIDLAIDELDDIKFDFVRRMKQVEIAPILTLMGNSAGAIAMLSSFRGLDREKSLERAIQYAARNGDVAGINALRGAFTLYKNRANRFLLEALDTMVRRGHRVAALTLADQMRDDAAIAGNAGALYRIATIYYQIGDQAQSAILHDRAKIVVEDSYNIYAQYSSRAERLLHYLHTNDAAAIATAEEEFSYSEQRFRDKEDRRDVAPYLARIAIKKGDVEAAVALTMLFNTAESKATYLATIAKLTDSAPPENLASAVDAVLEEVGTLTSALERDDVRLKLLEGARGFKNLSLATRIVFSMEDDDNAAKGLALLLPLVVEDQTI